MVYQIIATDYRILEAPGFCRLVARLPIHGPERTEKGDKMKRTLWFLVISLGLVTGTVRAALGAAPASSTEGSPETFSSTQQSLALILVGDGGGRVSA